MKSCYPVRPLTTLLTVLVSVVFGALFIGLRESEIQKSYDWPVAVARGAQQGLTAGISPDGVIEALTYDLYWEDSYDFTMPMKEPTDIVFIKETAKVYQTSSDNILEEHVTIPYDFYKDIQSTGENRAGMVLGNRKRYALQAYPYSYGDVRGFVAVGRVSVPNQEMIQLYALACVTGWVISVLYLRDQSHTIKSDRSTMRG